MGTLYVEDAWNVFVDHWKPIVILSGILAAILGAGYLAVWELAKAGAGTGQIAEIAIPIAVAYMFAYLWAQIYIYTRADGRKADLGKTLAAAVRAIVAEIIIGIIILLIALGLIAITMAITAISTTLGVLVGILAFIAAVVIFTVILLKMMYISVLAARGLSVGDILRKAYAVRLGPAGKAVVGAFIIQLLVGVINNVIQTPVIAAIVNSMLKAHKHGAGVVTAIAAIPAGKIILAIAAAWITLFIGAIIWFFPYVSAKDAIPEKA